MPLKEYQLEVVEEFERWYSMLKEEYKQVADRKATIHKMEQIGLMKIRLNTCAMTQKSI